MLDRVGPNDVSLEEKGSDREPKYANFHRKTEAPDLRSQALQ